MYRSIPFEVARSKTLFYILFKLFLIINCSVSTNSQKFKIVVRKGDELIINRPLPPSFYSKQSIHLENQPLIYRDGTISIQSELSSAFDTCFMSKPRTSLVIFSKTEEQFLETLRNMTERAASLKAKFNLRQTFCEIFIVNLTCHHTFPHYKAKDFQALIKSSEHLKFFPFDFLSDLYTVQYCTSSNTLKIWEIYSAKNVLFIKHIYDSKLSSKSDTVTLNLTEFSMFNQTKIMRRQNLDGIDIIASVFLKENEEDDNQLEVKFGRDVSGETILESGLSVSIMHDFRKVMNFTEKVLKIHFTDNYFMTAFTSEEFHFDINLFHTSVTKNRSKVAQPLHPTFFDGVHAIFVQPFDNSARNIYQKPFAGQMWRLLFLSWSSIFLSSKIIMYLQLKFIYSTTNSTPDNDHEAINDTPEDQSVQSEDTEYISSFETSLWCIAVICQQGWHQLPSSISMRMVIVTSLMLSFVSYSAYTGKIVSELWNVPKPITSLHSLLTGTKNIFLVEASDTSYDVLEGLEQRASNLLSKVRFKPMEQITPKLIGTPGQACVITWPDNLIDFVRDIKKGESEARVYAYLCDTFSSFSFQAQSSLFVPKTSEFVALFNYRIMVGLQRGLIRRYWNIYKRQAFLSCLGNDAKLTTLDFSHVFFAFVILFSGMLISLAILICEIFIQRMGWKFNLFMYDASWNFRRYPIEF